MPFNNANSTFGGMFDDLKSKLGFGHSDERYDDYEDYDDGYAEDGGYERDYNGDSYEDQEAVGGFRPASPYANRFNRNDISSSLVSIDDVKATTPLPDRLQRDPIAPASQSYDSSRSSARAASGQSAARSSVSSSYDPYEAYSSSSSTSYSPMRSLTVLKPTSYSDVERIARAVKSGDVVVLAMRNTPDDLSKRILDFSFGVASALDANVECPADKVFAIARGNALNDGEKSRLHAQGVL